MLFVSFSSESWSALLVHAAAALVVVRDYDGFTVQFPHTTVAAIDSTEHHQRADEAATMLEIRE